MRAKDLRKYKTLDITELSGSPWNDAEKVLGLDQDDKVIMAEPEETATPEYVGEAIEQAMEAETARTEDTYAKKSEVPDLDDYYTKEEVDEAISGITVDLSDYYTKEEVDELIDGIPEPDLSDYYTKGETDQAISAATQDMATEQYVDEAVYDLPNRQEVEDAISTAATEMHQYVDDAIANETARTESTYAKPSDIPSLDGYATETYVDDAIAAIPQVDLSDYAKTTAVTQDIQTAMASETARTENTYAKPSQIPSLDGYATEDWVEEQGYLTEHQDLSAYAKTTAVTEDIQTAMATETGRTEEVYAKKSEIPSLDGYATQAWTTGDTESRIASAMASETARTESTYLKEHQSLDNYYTKSEVDAEITGATEGLASEQYVNDAIAAIPSVDLSAYAKTTAVTQDIQTAMAAETARTESTYLKEHQSLDNYYTKSEVDADFVSAATAVGNAIDAAVQGLASEDYVDNALAGLASEGYVDAAVTAATENLATKQYVDDAIDSIPGTDLSDYYTKSEVDAEITGATADLATTTYVSDAVSNLETAVVDEFEAETARTESTYAKLSQIPSLAGYATETYVDNAIASETARTESTYLKEHQDISGKLDKTDFNTYTGATETALAGKLDASAYTVDNAFDSASTNPVENRAIYEAFYGVTTELVVSSQSSGQYINWQSEDWSTQGTLFLYNTNDPSIYVAKPKEWAGNIKIMPSEFILNGGSYSIANVDYQDPLVLGETYQLGRAGTYPLLDLTTEGETYIILDGVNNTVVFSKTLPSAHTPSDLIPYAQDGSDTKQFVYNDDNNANHRVVSKVYLGTGYQVRIVGAGSFVPSAGVYPNYYSWTNQQASGSTAGISAGSEVARGVKTLRDSVIIGRAEEALSGMTETVTLTLGTQPGSQYRIFVNGASYSYLYATNNPRYYAFPLSNITATDGSYWELRDFYIGGTRYYISNPLALNDSNVKTNGKCQLYQGTQSMGYHCVQNDSASKYVIVDTELLTIEITDSLTFTRTKSIQQMIDNIPAPDMSNYWTSAQTQSAITAATQGMVTSGDVATQIGTAMASETARTESTYAKPSQIPSLNGYATEAWVGQQGYLTSQSLTNYYTKTEIDGMIGDIESLLASI